MSKNGLGLSQSQILDVYQDTQLFPRSAGHFSMYFLCRRSSENLVNFLSIFFGLLGFQVVRVGTGMAAQ